MESSDSEQNESAAHRFQRLVGNRSEYYAKQVQDSESRREMLKAHERARTWFAVKVCIGTVFTSGAGLFVMGWALHTTDAQAGELAWLLGPIIGYGLTLILVGWAAVKWEKDDW